MFPVIFDPLAVGPIFFLPLQGWQRHRGNKSVGSLNGWQVLFSTRRQRCPRKVPGGGGGVAVSIEVSGFLNLGRCEDERRYYAGEIFRLCIPQKNR